MVRKLLIFTLKVYRDVMSKMFLQRTIQREIHCRNIGLHSGRKVAMTIKPADADAGITFVRNDVAGRPEIRARYDGVSDTTLATTIGCNGTRISTIEHLMSALFGMGVDNAVVEVDAPELPIMDGSALPFVDLLKSVGTRAQGRCKKILVVEKPVSVEDGYGSATFLPAPEFRITCEIDFDHPVIGHQTFSLTFSDDLYEKEICAARTFGFLKDVEYLQASGLALGGSLKNAVVMDETRILNKEGLRCPDEFVKHKILDAIGDLSLLGMPVIGHLIARKSGHRLNNLLLRELMNRRDCWRIVSALGRKDATTERTGLKAPAFRILDAAAVRA